MMSGVVTLSVIRDHHLLVSYHATVLGVFLAFCSLIMHSKRRPPASREFVQSIEAPHFLPQRSVQGARRHATEVASSPHEGLCQHSLH